MNNKYLSIAGVIILIFVGWMIFHTASAPALVQGIPTNQCATGQTCLPSMELTGPLSGVTNALQIDTANTATSTLTVGCIQTTATSTATIVRLVLSSAASSTPTFGAGNAVGGVSWQYGTCPI